MFSGFLDQQITVSRIEKMFDGRGGYTNREVSVGEFWAALHPIGITERAQYQALNTDVTVKVYMQYDPQITKGMFLSHRGKRYEVKGVINPAFQDKYLELVVSEV